jgi:hypothetical protein
MRSAFVVLTVVALTSAACAAESAPVGVDRYSMTPTSGGFLRLDKQTGQVAFCTVEAGLAACRIGADERAALETDVARLRRENAELKGARAAAPSALPKDEELERALSFTERYLRRIIRLFKEEASGDKI